MPYTITDWQDRPDFGGPVFTATLGDDTYRVSGIDYTFTAHDGDHRFHEVIVWRNGESVYEVNDTAKVIPVFHDYLTSEGLYA
jgi:hypothetical protein